MFAASVQAIEPPLYSHRAIRGEVNSIKQPVLVHELREVWDCKCLRHLAAQPDTKARARREFTGKLGGAALLGPQQRSMQLARSNKYKHRW